MEKGKLIWKDGKIIPWNSKKAMVHVSNHSLNYGSAVFEGIRFYGTPGNSKGNLAIFRLEDHVERLFYSASIMGNAIRDFSKKDISNAIIETVKVNEFSEGYVRPLVYSKSGIGIDFENKGIGIAMMVFPWERYSENSVGVYVTKLRRPHQDSTNIGAKIAGNYHNSVLAHIEARENGYEECLQLDDLSNIAEGPGENIFFVKDKQIVTSESGKFLSGITRDSLITISRGKDFEIKESTLNPRIIHDADEAFFCGTAIEVTPISEISYLDEVKKYKTHEVTNKIKDLYMNTVRGKNKKHLNWLTLIK